MKFRQLIAPLPKPEASIVEAIETNNTPFKHLDFFKNNSDILGAKEYIRVYNQFKDKFPNQKPSPEQLNYKVWELLSQISLFENPVKKELIQISKDVIQELYNVPTNLIDFNISIEPNPFLDISPNKTKEPHPDRINYINSEINKRILLNGLVHSSSMHIWKSAHHLIKNSVSESIFALYEQFVSSVGLSLWQTSIKRSEAQIKGNAKGLLVQGYNKIEFKENNKISIEIKTTNLPILIHEINKAVIDLLTYKYIPTDFSSDELDYYYEKSNNYLFEPYHYYLSASIWSQLLEAIEVDSNKIPAVISYLSSLSYTNLSFCFEQVLTDKFRFKKKLVNERII